jgi:subtilisin family serine protease
MTHEPSRRTFLRGIGILAGTTALPRRAKAVDHATDRFIVEMSTASVAAMSNMTIVHDLRDELGYIVTEGPEAALPAGANYTHDHIIEITVPQETDGPANAHETEETFYDLEWDKQEQQIQQVHQFATGEGARVGIIDGGVLASHPDLAGNVREDLSRNFTDDDFGPGPLANDHGTHVAGTAAAVANGRGVVGHAPDAEIVDLRVFSGPSASFGDILAAVVYSAQVGCDAVNLSLGTPLFVPVNDSDAVEDPDDPGAPSGPNDGPIEPIARDELQTLVDSVSDAGRFAVNNGTLPVASAGNDGTNIDAVVESLGAAPVTLPAEATGFMSVGATGPIGYGWPLDGQGQDVGGYAVESPINTELPTSEPAYYTNYGSNGVDVTAPGGNVDFDAAGQSVNYFYDLVLSTTFDPVFEDGPDNGTQKDKPGEIVNREPSYGWKAGTSMAAPQVTGLAALLAAKHPDASPTTIRQHIEDTALPLPIGRGGETTAPGATPNEATDGDFNGDQLSSPGSNLTSLDSETYRGEGHINTLIAVRQPL